MTKSEKNKSAISAVTGHFKEKLSGKLMKYTCKEWKLDIYYKALASLNVENKIMSMQQQGKTAEALVESILLKALNADGDRLFSNMDKDELLNEADPNVIVKVASVLNNANSETVEDIEKN